MAATAGVRGAANGNATPVRLAFLVIDTPDPAGSAAFYSTLLEVPVVTADDDWVELAGDADGVTTVAFQHAPGLEPPDWPDERHPQRAHLDLEVDDLDDGERRALAAGARKADHQPGRRFRVFHDPTGHPFCLVLHRAVPG